MALRDCFSRIYRRTTDVETGFCFIDVGRSATRVMIMRAGHLYFARSIPIGSEHFNQAVADAVGVQPSEARLLRAQLAEQQQQAEGRSEPAARPATAPGRPAADTENSFALLSAAVQAGDGTQPARAPAQAGGAEAYVMRSPARAAVHQTATPRATAAPAASLVTEMSVGQAIDPVVHDLADEIQRCRRYHESTFPNVTVDRLVFVGGEAHVRSLCQSLARRLGISAQLGDPIVGLCHDVSARREVPDLLAAGIDRRRPQPAWAVACGLSLGAPA
jgi:Tfp pilus assembly PilM family ATPase